VQDDFPERAKRLDRSNMLGDIMSIPAQIEGGFDLGSRLSPPEHDSICVSGMGGSAIPGDILADLASRKGKKPIFVNRGYSLPQHVNGNTFLVVISYSGNTEETLTSFKDGLDRGAPMISITSGGDLKLLSKENGIPLVEVPTGLQPRAAMGYLLFSLLGLLRDDIALTNEEVEKTSTEVSHTLIANSIDAPENESKSLARFLVGKSISIYGVPYLEGATRRFKCQLNENSKVIARYELFPEMSHNDIVGWGGQDLERNSIVILRSDEDNPRIKRRIDITKKLAFNGRAREVIAPSLALYDVMCLIAKCDLASYYLALLREVDPTPVEIIKMMKRQLGGG
jgi:glucose/mannose-6-phosphate isomerase